jgi:hypothetical protein
MKKVLLYIVISLSQPGPKWRKASDLIPRHEAVLVVAGEWQKGHLARLVPEQKQAAA